MLKAPGAELKSIPNYFIRTRYHRQGEQLLHECSLGGKCTAENVIYKCVASLGGYPNKHYLRTAVGDFKLRFYNHQNQFH